MATPFVHEAPTAGEGSCVCSFPMTNLKWMHHWTICDFAACRARGASSAHALSQASVNEAFFLRSGQPPPLRMSSSPPLQGRQTGSVGRGLGSTHTAKLRTMPPPPSVRPHAQVRVSVWPRELRCLGRPAPESGEPPPLSPFGGTVSSAPNRFCATPIALQPLCNRLHGYTPSPRQGKIMHKYPKNQSSVVQVGKQSQQMCPRVHVIGRFVTKPMSYVAALHLYLIKLGKESIQPAVVY